MKRSKKPLIFFLSLLLVLPFIITVANTSDLGDNGIDDDDLIYAGIVSSELNRTS